MPIYDYSCPECGPFTAMRPMAEFRDPGVCPTCGVHAWRAFIQAPALSGMDQAGRQGRASHNSDESNRHATKTAHPAGCGCCVRRPPIPAALASKGRVFASNGPAQRSSR